MTDKYPHLDDGDLRRRQESTLIVSGGVAVLLSLTAALVLDEGPVLVSVCLFLAAAISLLTGVAVWRRYENERRNRALHKRNEKLAKEMGL